jgi:transposase InsO family protein
VARTKRRSRSLTKADRSARKAPDALRRGFTARPDVRWFGDLTEIPTDEGKFHLAVILDLHSRRCVGFALGAHHDAELARAALCVAIAIRGGSVAGVFFHTDQGGEYTGEGFADACRRTEITQSIPLPCVAGTPCGAVRRVLRRDCRGAGLCGSVPVEPGHRVRAELYFVRH